MEFRTYTKWLSKYILLVLKSMTPMLILVSINVNPANAFCIENRTDERLIFAAEPQGEMISGVSFRKWLDPLEKTCGNPNKGNNIIRIFVFSEEDAIEGCDAVVGAQDTLTLISFVKFDRCDWAEPVTVAR